MRLALTIAAALTLAGCATNAIRLDRASAMKLAGEQAALGTHAVLAEVHSANREKLVAVAALDPACALPTPVIAAPTRTDVRVCIPQGSTPGPGDFPLTRFDARAFGPAIATLEALSTYLGAVDAILTEKQVDVGAELDDAIGKLQGAAGDIATIVGAPAPPGLNDDQRAAVQGALSLVSTLANEAHTVKALRRLDTPEQEQAFADTLAHLRAVNDGLATILSEELQQQRKVLDLTRAIPPDPHAQLPDRRADRREEMGLIERGEDIAELKAALATALDALQTSHDDYLALLRDAKAPLTDEEQLKKARLTQERVLAALSSLAKLARAF